MDDEELIAASARNHRSRFAEKSEVIRPGLTVNSYEAILAFPESDADIDEALSLARERGAKQAGCWTTLPSPVPELGLKLVARGFSWGWQPRWMALDLAQTIPDAPLPPSVSIEPASEPFGEAPGLPYYDPANASESTERTHVFVARENGRPVGWSVLHVTDGEPTMAGMYSVGVVPEARHRGIGRALVRFACDHARRIGCGHVLLNAATDIYSALGFRTLGYGQTWWIQRDALAKTPLSLEVVEFTEALGRGTLGAWAEPPIPLDEPLVCGWTPMELAARFGSNASADWLLTHGATPDIVALYDLGREDLPELLRMRPELANRRRGPWSITPLHIAAERGDTALARLLLAAAPDLTVKDTNFGGTPLGWARHLGRKEIAALLEAAGGEK